MTNLQTDVSYLSPPTYDSLPSFRPNDWPAYRPANQNPTSRWTCSLNCTKIQNTYSPIDQTTYLSNTPPCLRPTNRQIDPPPTDEQAKYRPNQLTWFLLTCRHNFAWLYFGIYLFDVPLFPLQRTNHWDHCLLAREGCAILSTEHTADKEPTFPKSV